MKTTSVAPKVITFWTLSLFSFSLNVQILHFILWQRFEKYEDLNMVQLLWKCLWTLYLVCVSFAVFNLFKWTLPLYNAVTIAVIFGSCQFHSVFVFLSRSLFHSLWQCVCFFYLSICNISFECDNQINNISNCYSNYIHIADLVVDIGSKSWFESVRA